MIHAGTRGAGRERLNHALENELPFKTSGSLSGDTYIVTYGQLNHEEIAQLEADREIGIRYFVISYKTPIAWVRNDGKIYCVKQHFSVTTSKHQGHLYKLGGNTK